MIAFIIIKETSISAEYVVSYNPVSNTDIKFSAFYNNSTNIINCDNYNFRLPFFVDGVIIKWLFYPVIVDENTKRIDYIVIKQKQLLTPAGENIYDHIINTDDCIKNSIQINNNVSYNNSVKVILKDDTISIYNMEQLLCSCILSKHIQQLSDRFSFITGFMKLYNFNNYYLEYEGDVINGIRNGNGASYYNHTGANIIKYKGGYNNNKRHGYGISYYSDGTVEYEGNWENHKRCGAGKSYYTNGSIMYDCIWKDNLCNGTGISYNQSGSIKTGMIYRGEFKDGMYNGVGSLYCNTIVYKGEFKNNKYDGIGTAYMNGIVIYKGEFKDSNYNGTGILYKDNNFIYKGEFKDNMKHGMGFLYDIKQNLNPDLNPELVYEGMFINNLRMGKGKSYKDGIIDYEGNFKDNMRHGRGVSYHNDGTIEYDGIWKDDKLLNGTKYSRIVDGREIKPIFTIWD